MEGTESFNLHQTMEMVGQAFTAVVCHVLFDAAMHGFVIALLFAVIGFVLYKRKFKAGVPFMQVGRRLAIVCAIMMLPGLGSLLLVHHLPSTGFFAINSMGFIAFWSLICVHFSAEEMNFQWF